MLPTMSAMQEKLLSQNCLHALHCQPLRLRCRHARRASTFFCNAQRASSKAPCCDRHASSNKLAAEVHQVASMQPDRRALISAALLLSATVPVAALAGPGQQDGLTEFFNSKQGYRLDRPQQWEQTSKAGADVLFADPANKSTTIGVTVSPIRIASLEKFGDVETVRKRLIDTEKQKESTLDVAVIQESSRRGKSGTLIYDIEYELNSTRGRKRILSTVGIANKKLFIVNGNFKCSANGCSEQESSVTTLRQVASTFDVVT